MGLKDLLFNEPEPPPKPTAPTRSVMEPQRVDRPPASPTNNAAAGALKKRVIPPSGPLSVFLSITTSLAKFIPGIPERTAAALETLINQGSSKEMLTLNIEDAKDNLAAERSRFQQVINLPSESYDDARTLRMGEWRTLWEVVIRGRMHEVFDILRTNYAIGWMMLPAVEGLFREEGGIGVLLLTQNKYFRLEAVYAIGVIIAGIGLAQDYVAVGIKRLVCPYAFINLERS